MTSIELLLWSLLAVLGLATILTFIRLLLGPTLSDRVVALDLLSAFGIGIISVYAILTGQPIFLDVAAVLALIAFLTTVAFAYYIERRFQT
jgi:multicomponent Na+:H+ antiporter subunit F